MTRRVVVTGIGLVTPLGHTREESWRNILAGKSGIAPLTRFDPADSPVKIAAEVKDWNPDTYMSPKLSRRHDRNQQFTWVAAHEAMQQAGFEVNDANRHRTAIITGSAVGGVEGYFIEAKQLLETNDMRKVTPFGISMLMVNGGADMISIDLGILGPNYTLASACATGADCIGHAFDLIRLGRVDQALAGAAEAPVIKIGIAVFDRLGAMSRENDTPERACRPFDKTRTGLVFGEGAGVLVLEELEYAKKRGANIIAELVGYGSTSDGYHMTAPHPEGIGAIRTMKMALDDGQVNASEIEYINAHGTGTSLNDVVETKAVKSVFGEQAYNIPMSSTKSMTGHGMGATAAIEAGFAILSMRDSIVPPTINLHEPDPECDLDYVANQSREMKVDATMSNSFGFGGHNVSLVFKSFNGK
ncbi:MAG: beta-ketoacyl-ACP synthase II [Anaerolineae bacterium]